ncbi:hypothetical protein [Bifidobacterium ruminantium]|uniref:hypothetical protein n=1 Tax=Bifidobacterium ruminantium TaxID=78346 RepID=UPI001C23F9CB|nr:hypothetical protein [Bifidobacterium ruminantium]MBU9111874.1 hypothetical protein [Bifidobacterium ruminantium]
MTIELVDGKAGVEHISSEDKAIIHQAKFGKSDMVFDWGDALKCSIVSSNKATIGTGCASIQGLDWHITAAERVTIQNGSQGMKRNDIIAAHYHRDSTSGNEKVELVVLKGTPDSNTAADPTIPSGKILSGAVDAYMPLWRIPLDGITVGTPVRLFTPRGALWDSVTQTLIKSQYGTVTGVKSGKIAQISINWKSASPDSWGRGQFGTIPEGWRPAVVTHGTWSGRDGGSQRDFILETNGNFSYANCGAVQNSGTFSGTMTYILA